MRKIGILTLILIVIISSVVKMMYRVKDPRHIQNAKFNPTTLSDKERTLLREKYSLEQLKLLKKSQTEIALAEDKVKALEKSIRDDEIKKNPNLVEEYRLIDKIKSLRIKVADSKKQHLNENELARLENDLHKTINELQLFQKKNNPYDNQFYKYKELIADENKKLSNLIQTHQTQEIIDQERKKILMIKLEYINKRPSHFKTASPQILQLESEIKEDLDNNVPIEVIEKKSMHLLLLKEKGI